ncbi:MAG: outer membrane beta-barrel protein [Candidatus Goldbacteria bacterium]|nr:outer membrane beta-barrel protein [Candidatus Goldiibacteriota bacterium]
MKKILSLLAVMSLFAVPSYALLHVGVSAGYAYANMDQMNNAWETVKTDAQEQNMPSEVQKFGNSIFVNADLGIGLLPIVNIGPRVGLQYVLPVKNSVSYINPLEPSETLSMENTISSMLIPLELGVSANLTLPMLPISITVGGYAGYGLAFGLDETKITSNIAGNQEIKYAVPYDGGGFMADATAAVEWNILPLINLSLNAGYRYALIENVNVTNEVKDPISGDVLISADEELTSLAGDKLKVNYTGFLVGLGLNIRF